MDGLLLARVNTCTSCPRRDSSMAQLQPTLGSDPLSGSQAYAESSIFILNTALRQLSE